MAKKCKHDKCKRRADLKDNDGGFCNRCIQLPTRECNYCDTAEKDKSEERKIADKIMNPHREQIIKCPKCKINMEKMSNGRYVIDKCPKCRGIFLDGNEINMIKHVSFYHYIKDYFRKGKHA